MNKMMLAVIRATTKTIEFLSNKWAGLWIDKLFFSPHKRHKKTLALENMQTQWLNFHSTFDEPLQCKVYKAGSGPTVLLVHGWEGSAYSYSTLSHELINAGFTVVLCDFPAHGQSPGSKTNLDELHRLIKILSEKYNSIHAVIGHSFGGFATAYAIKFKLPIKQFISISTPVDMDFIINSLCTTIGASSKSKKHLIGSIESIIKAPYQSASIKNNGLIKSVKGLIIHDQKDKVVPYDHAKALQALWPNTELISTCGLGHSGILRDATVIKPIIDYLKNIK